MKDWLPDIPAFIEDQGYFAVWLLMFIETFMPIFPSEVVLPLGALAASHGKMSLWGVALAGTIGAMCGATVWYVLARWLGLERFTALVTKYGRWTTMSPAIMNKLQSWFEKYGAWVVFGGRLIPGVRSAVSIPAGITKMPLLPFFAYSVAGAGIWCSFVTWIGWLFRSHIESVHDYIGPVVKLIVVGLLAVWLYRVVTYKPTPAES